MAEFVEIRHISAAILCANEVLEILLRTNFRVRGVVMS